MGKRWGNRSIQYGVIHFAIQVERGIDLAQGFTDKAPMVDGFWKGGVTALFYDFHHFLLGKARLQEVAFRLWREESELHGLATQPQRNGKIPRLNGLMTDINNSVSDAIGDTGEEHAFEPPIREKQQFFVFTC